jgi:hypothetical protein
MALHNQTVGNAGLYYVCFQLSLRGWNAMPTARNARGIDILVYSRSGTRKLGIQVKALSKKNPVPLGQDVARLMGDFWIVCRNIAGPTPECFILEPGEVRAFAHRGEKDGRVSFWLQPKAYDRPEFREAWHRIGTGVDE